MTCPELNFICCSEKKVEQGNKLQQELLPVAQVAKHIADVRLIVPDTDLS